MSYTGGEIEIRHYLTRAGKDIFDEWLTELADARAQAKVASRINRLAAGNFGDCKSLRQGLYELRIDWGPGYRVYFTMTGRTCMLLLCGGDKRKQSSDIARALECVKDYKERSGSR
ncbi:MAG: type II toxin-antitoxin system RelE/ParE family toxin [Candidatus Acidiferrum sp.]|jgi:putative addiction module killer protein